MRVTSALIALFALFALSACQQPKPAPDKAEAAPAAASAPAPSVDADARDREIARALAAARPYQRGGRVGAAWMDASAFTAMPETAAPAFAKLEPRLSARFGPLTPVTPLALQLGAAEAGGPALDAIRRAGAALRLDYVLVFQLAPTEAKRTGGGLFGATRWAGETVGEAVIVDVRSGAILGAARAIGASDAKAASREAAEMSAAAAAMAALGQELDVIGRRLDGEAMRAQAPRDLAPLPPGPAPGPQR